MDKPSSTPSLVRGLGTWDAAFLTFGAVIGTGIFLAPGDVARAMQHPGWTLAVWLLGGALVLAGAFAYAELGTMFPRAGGLYQFLREAWGPMWGFLYGWTCLLVIMTGGIAAIAVGFGEYFGEFVPALSGERTVWSVEWVGVRWDVRGSQVGAALAILGITAANHFGLRAGALLQGVSNAVKLAAILGLAAIGCWLPAEVPLDLGAPSPIPPAALPAAVGVAMIATLWTYDGWYTLTFSGGEVRDPARTLPLGLLVGVLAVVATYVLVNVVYLRALGVAGLAATPRAAEATALALAGPGAARVVVAAVALSAFGCLCATILCTSRIYQPMAADGAFFPAVARIHPRHRTPVTALWLQSVWAAILALTGSYTQLFTYVTFGGLLFHVACGLGLFRLRATRPHAPRPHRAIGYPMVPALFVGGAVLLAFSTLFAAPRESLLGLLAIAAGVPAYAAWRRSSRAHRERDRESAAPL